MVLHSPAGVSGPLANYPVLDPGQLLEGRAVEEDGNGDNPPSSSLCTCTSQGSGQYAGRSQLN